MAELAPEPWIDIIGIGEDGEAGLSAGALEVLQKAEVIIGGDRHHKLTSNSAALRIAWPSPFNAMIDEIRSNRGKRLVILVTGDPLWYSVGARITKSIPAGEIRFHPHLSAFQLAACRMGWSLADIETVTIHGRPASQLVPHLAPGVRMIVLTQNASSPEVVSRLLVERGFSRSSIVAFAAMGGPNEKRFAGSAGDWNLEVPDFHVLAIECVADEAALWYGRTGGLPDDAFDHDGKITKQEVRAATIAKLNPFPDALLWDIGAGCGSVSVEWMRAARGAVACAIEPNAQRRNLILENSRKLGTEKIQIIEAPAPKCLNALPAPNAIFIGGGLGEGEMVEYCIKALQSGGYLVANAVTLESISILVDSAREYGGDLAQIAVSRSVPVGKFRGWKPLMPVTQWTYRKATG